jgi:Mannose-6-phosphate isomerase
MSEAAVTTAVDLAALCRAATGNGPQWGHESEDLDVTLLSWSTGGQVEPHVNREVDVLWIGLEGEGVVTIDGAAHPLRPGAALLIPKHSERSVECRSGRLSYLSIHKRRAGLRPTLGRNGPRL